MRSIVSVQASALLFAALLFCAIPFSSADHNHDGEDYDWLRCVGSSSHCPGFHTQDWRNDTLPKQLAAAYFQAHGTINYTLVSAIISPTIDLFTEGTVHLVGSSAFMSAFSGIDPLVAYRYKILPMTKPILLVGEGDTVFADTYPLFLNLVTNTTFVNHAYHQFTINSINQIQAVDIYVNLPYVSSQLAVPASLFTLDPTTVCSNIMADCTGFNAQYANFSACLARLTGIPATSPTGIKPTGNNVACFEWIDRVLRTLNDPVNFCPKLGASSTQCA